MDDMIERFFLDLHENYRNEAWIREGPFITTQNAHLENNNSATAEMIPGIVKEYLGPDTLENPNEN